MQLRTAQVRVAKKSVHYRHLSEQEGCTVKLATLQRKNGAHVSITASLNTSIGQRRSHRWMIYTCINWFDLILPESSKFFKINCRLSQISNVPFYSELELFPPQFELKEALPYWFCIRRTTSDWASANQSKPTLISNCGAKSMLH